MKLWKFLFSRKCRNIPHCTVLSFITKSAQFRALIAIKASFLSWFILNIALKSEHDMTNERPILEMLAKKKSIDLIDEGSIEPGTKTWLDPFFNTMYNNCALPCSEKRWISMFCLIHISPSFIWSTVISSLLLHYESLENYKLSEILEEKKSRLIILMKGRL